MEPLIKENMLSILLKTSVEAEEKQDKMSVLLKVGFKYLKLCSKMFSAKKIVQAGIILELMQRSVNQIYLSEESYMWSLLKIRLIITRLQYLQENEAPTNNAAPVKKDLNIKVI